MNSPSMELFQPVHLPEMEAAAIEVLRSGQIASGPKVSALEHAFKAIAGREHIVATDDLSSAVTLALHLAGVCAGDGVATVTFSCLQSNSPIARLGANPVWIDIDPLTMSMSVEDLEKKLKPSIKAVMVYHIAGYPSDIRRIAAICRGRGVKIIEDCNNAIGATLDDGHPVGTIGDYAVYSLYPNRQINGIDGGILVTPDATTAERATRLRRFGLDARTFRDSRGQINPKSDISEIGWSATMSNINAAIAISQLDSIWKRMTRTKENAFNLLIALNNLKKTKPINPLQNTIPAFWGFLVLSKHRNSLIEHLEKNNIKSSVLHQRNDWYSGFSTSRAELPGTEQAMKQLLALPCGYWLSDSQFKELIFRIEEFDNF